MISGLWFFTTEVGFPLPCLQQMTKTITSCTIFNRIYSWIMSHIGLYFLWEVSTQGNLRMFNSLSERLPQKIHGLKGPRYSLFGPILQVVEDKEKTAKQSQCVLIEQCFAILTDRGLCLATKGLCQCLIEMKLSLCNYNMVSKNKQCTHVKKGGHGSPLTLVAQHQLA